MFSVSALSAAEPHFPRSVHDTATDAIDYAELSVNADDFTDDHVVFLVRNPIDTAVSWYYHKVYRARDWSGDIDTFVRDPHWGVRKIVSFYNAWYAARNIPAAFMPVAYEQLHKRPQRTLHAVLDFLNLSADYHAHVKSAVQATSFEAMRHIECDRTVPLAVDKLRARGDRTVEELTDTRCFKVREGRVNGGKRHLSRSTIRQCQKWIREMDCAYYANQEAWQC
jgi:hypothetical protein